MSVLSRLLGRSRIDRRRLLPLYDAVVAEARDPAWYRQGGVPDTVDGRFDMVTAVLALVLLRLEREEGDEAPLASAQLTELFVEDMDGSLRQMGIGDLMVGKHIGNMMGALGGRVGAFRDSQDGFAAAASRNIFHDAPPSDEALDAVAARLRRLHVDLEAVPAAQLLEGRLRP